jgi:hypothetical protein
MDEFMKEQTAGHDWAIHPPIHQSNNPVLSSSFPGNLLPPFLKEQVKRT